MKDEFSGFKLGSEKRLLSAWNLLRLFPKWIKSKIIKDKGSGPQRLQTELVKTLGYEDYFEYILLRAHYSLHIGISSVITRPVK